jgi:hypothetical protein
VTWEITLETHRLCCSRQTVAILGRSIRVDPLGWQNNSAGRAVKCKKSGNGSARNYLRRPSFWTTVL